MCGLYADALQAVRSSLQSTNETLRLKAAMYVIGKVEMIDASRQDPETEIRKACTTIEEAGWDLLQPYENFDESKYKELMKENGLM